MVLGYVRRGRQSEIVQSVLLLHVFLVSKCFVSRLILRWANSLIKIDLL